MKKIFIGSVFDHPKELLKFSACVSASSNQYQCGFLSGLQEKIEILSCLILPTFPRNCKKLIFRKSTGRYLQNTITYMPFVNLHVFKDFCFKRALKKELKQRLRDGEKAAIYVYNLYMPFLRVMRWLKKRYGDRVDLCLIVPDLPGVYGVMRKRNSWGGLRDRLEAKGKMESAVFADRYVFLTEEMKALFPPKPSVVIEGFLPEIERGKREKRDEKAFLYTGTFAPQFGVKMLVDAFRQIEDPDYKLWLCGAGGVQQEVEKAAKEDQRITYFGYVSKEKVTELQAKCGVLINPRQPEGEYTKYSFPSKTMEYLLSGSKVLMYRLPGVGKDYYEYIYTVDGETTDDLKQAMIKTCEDDTFYGTKDLEQIRWITEHKNAEAQCEKLKKF